MQGFHPSDELLYQIVVPLSTEPESKSDELLHEVVAQFSDEE